MARFFERLPSLRASLPWILFALSVTLNVFFLGGYYYKRTFDQRLLANEQARVRYVMDQLHFDPEQRDRFKAFRDHTHEHAHAMFRANRPIIDNLWREIEKPQPDTAQLDDYINTLTANRLAFQRGQMHDLVAFAQTLEPKQRVEFLELVRARLERGFPRRPEMRPQR